MGLGKHRRGKSYSSRNVPLSQMSDRLMNKSLLQAETPENKVRSAWGTEIRQMEREQMNSSMNDHLMSELIQYEPEINYGKLEGKLLEQKRNQRMFLLSQASTRAAVSFNESGNGFNQFVPKKIAI